MASAPLTIASVFGDKKDVAKLLKEFDFSKIDVRDKEKKDYLHCDLAPSFGQLTEESIKKLDDKLKVMITAVTKSIAKIPPDGRTWDKVVSALQQNLLIEPLDDGIYRSDKLVKKGVNVFKVDGSPSAPIVKEVNSWFVNLISDADVLAATKIDISVLAGIVAQSGATIDSFETVFFKHEFHEKTMLDIGVLRYPDIEHPYFKVYRIKLVAWSDSTRYVFVQEDSNGITGEYNVRKYKPRDSVINELKKEIFQQAVTDAEAFLSS